MRDLDLSRVREFLDSGNAIIYALQEAVSLFFVSPKCFMIEEWRKDDLRIHDRPNCRYRDHRTAIDILYDLIKAGMLKKREEE